MRDVDPGFEPGKPDLNDPNPSFAEMVNNNANDGVHGARPKVSRQGKGRRPTKLEQAAVVAHVKQMLSRYAYDHEVVLILKQRYQYPHSTCRKYLSRAKAELREEAKLPPEAAKEKSYSFWVSVLRDPTADLRYKMEAQARIDNMLGTNAPIRVEANVGMTEETRALVEARQRALQDAATREALAVLAEKMGGFDPNAVIDNVPIRPADDTPAVQYGLRELTDKEKCG